MTQNRVVVDESFTLNVFEDTNLTVKLEPAESLNPSQQSIINNNYVKVELIVEENEEENTTLTSKSTDLNSIKQEIKTESDDDTVDLTQPEDDCFVIEEKIDIEQPKVTCTSTEEIKEEPPDARVDNTSTTVTLNLKTGTSSINSIQSNFCDNVNVQSNNSEIDLTSNDCINVNVLVIKQENDTIFDVNPSNDNNIYQNNFSSNQKEASDKESMICSRLPNASKTPSYSPECTVSEDVELLTSNLIERESASTIEETTQENVTSVPSIVKLQQQMKKKLEHGNKCVDKPVRNEVLKTISSDDLNFGKKQEEISRYGKKIQNGTFTEKDKQNPKDPTTAEKVKPIRGTEYKNISDLLVLLINEQDPEEQIRIKEKLKICVEQEQNREKRPKCNNATIDLTEDTTDVENTTKTLHTSGIVDGDDLNNSNLKQVEHSRRTSTEIQTCQRPPTSSLNKEDLNTPSELNCNSVKLSVSLNHVETSSTTSSSSQFQDSLAIVNMKRKMYEVLRTNPQSKKSSQVDEETKKLKRCTSSSEFQNPISKCWDNSRKKALHDFKTALANTGRKEEGEENKKVLERRSSSSEFQNSKNSSHNKKYHNQKNHNSSQRKSSSPVATKKQQPVVSPLINYKIDALISSLHNDEPSNEETQKIVPNTYNSSNQHNSSDYKQTSAFMIRDNSARNLKISTLKRHTNNDHKNNYEYAQNEAQSSNHARKEEIQRIEAKAGPHRRNSTNTAQNNSLNLHSVSSLQHLSKSASKQNVHEDSPRNSKTSTLEKHANTHCNNYSRSLQSEASVLNYSRKEEAQKVEAKVDSNIRNSTNTAQNNSLNLHSVSSLQHLSKSASKQNVHEDSPRNSKTSTLEKHPNTDGGKNNSRSVQSEAPVLNNSRKDETQKIEAKIDSNIRNSANTAQNQSLNNRHLVSNNLLVSRQHSTPGISGFVSKNVNDSVSNVLPSNYCKSNSGSRNHQISPPYKSRNNEIQKMDSKIGPNKSNSDSINIIQNIPLNLHPVPIGNLNNSVASTEGCALGARSLNNSISKTRPNIDYKSNAKGEEIQKIDLEAAPEIRNSTNTSQNNSLNLHLVPNMQNLHNPPSSRQNSASKCLKNDPRISKMSTFITHANSGYKNNSSSRKNETPSSNKSSREEFQKIDLEATSEIRNSTNTSQNSSLNLHLDANMQNPHNPPSSRKDCASKFLKNDPRISKISAFNSHANSDYKNNSSFRKNEASSNKSRSEESQKIDSKVDTNQRNSANMAQNNHNRHSVSFFLISNNTSTSVQNLSNRSRCEEGQKINCQIDTNKCHSSNMAENNLLNSEAGLNICNSSDSRQDSALGNTENRQGNSNVSVLIPHANTDPRHNSGSFKNEAPSSHIPRSGDIQKLDAKHCSNTCNSSTIPQKRSLNLHPVSNTQNPRCASSSKNFISVQESCKISNMNSSSTTGNNNVLKPGQNNFQSSNLEKNINENKQTVVMLCQRIENGNNGQKEDLLKNANLDPNPNLHFSKNSMHVKANVPQAEVTLTKVGENRRKSVNLEPPETQQTNISISRQKSPKYTSEPRQDGRHVGAPQNVNQYPNHRTTFDIIQSSTSSNIQNKNLKNNSLDKNQKSHVEEPQNVVINDQSSKRVSSHCVQSSINSTNFTQQVNCSSPIQASSRHLNLQFDIVKRHLEVGLNYASSSVDPSRIATHPKINSSTQDSSRRPSLEMQRDERQGGKVPQNTLNNHLSSRKVSEYVRSLHQVNNSSSKQAVEQRRNETTQKRTREEMCTRSSIQNKVPKSSFTDGLAKKLAGIVFDNNLSSSSLPVQTSVPHQIQTSSSRQDSSKSPNIQTESTSRTEILRESIPQNLDKHPNQRTDLQENPSLEKTDDPYDEDELLQFMQHQLWQMMPPCRQNNSRDPRVHTNTFYGYDDKLRVIQHCLWQIIARNLSSSRQSDHGVDSEYVKSHQTNPDYDTRVRMIKEQLLEIIAPNTTSPSKQYDHSTDFQRSSNIGSRIEVSGVEVPQNNPYDHAKHLERAISLYIQYKEMTIYYHRNQKEDFRQNGVNLQNKRTSRAVEDHTYYRRNSASRSRQHNSTGRTSRKKSPKVPQRIESKIDALIESTSKEESSTLQNKDNHPRTSTNVSSSNHTSSGFCVPSGGNETEPHRIQSSKRSNDHLEERSSRDKKLHVAKPDDSSPSLQRNLLSMFVKPGESNNQCEQPTKTNQENPSANGFIDPRLCSAARFNETCNTIHEFMIGLLNPEVENACSLPVRLGQYFGPQIIKRLREETSEKEN